LEKSSSPKIKVWELEEVTIRSLNYLDRHQPQKFTARHSMQSMRLWHSNIKKKLFWDIFLYWTSLLITFLSPLWGLPSSTVASRMIPHSYFLLYSTGHSKWTVPSIVASTMISKFLHYTILVIISAKSFFQQNFNLI
jgi:hypothetical protein